MKFRAAMKEGRMDELLISMRILYTTAIVRISLLDSNNTF